MTGRGWATASEVTNTRSPRPRSTMGAARAVVSRWAFERFTESTRSKVEGSVSSAVAGRISPALETSTSTGPRAAVASTANRSVAWSSARSRGNATASPPASRMAAAVASQVTTRRAPRTTGWPAAASARAVAAPMPEEAPVTTAGRRSGWRSKRATSTRPGRRGQCGESPDVDGVHPLGARLVDLVVGDRADQLLEGDAPLEARQSGAHAEVAPTAETEDRRVVAVELEAVGRLEHRFVAVGRTDQENGPAAGRDPGSVELDVDVGGPHDHLG